MLLKKQGISYLKSFMKGNFVASCLGNRKEDIESGVMVHYWFVLLTFVVCHVV